MKNFWMGFEKQANLASMIAGLPSRRQLSAGVAKSIGGNRIQAVHPRPKAFPPTPSAAAAPQQLSARAQNATRDITRRRYADIK